MGVVLACDAEPESAKLKFLFDVAPASACLTPELLRLGHFLKERTFCTYYEAVKAGIEALTKGTETLAERRMDRSIREALSGMSVDDEMFDEKPEDESKNH